MLHILGRINQYVQFEKRNMLKRSATYSSKHYLGARRCRQYVLVRFDSTTAYGQVSAILGACGLNQNSSGNQHHYYSAK